MSAEVKCSQIEIVRGDDVVISCTIKIKDASGNYTAILDYTEYDWKSEFRYQKNSPIFYPAIVTINTSLNRLEITLPKTSTSKMSGSGYIDLQSTKKDDGSVRTWFISKASFVEDVTYE